MTGAAQGHNSGVAEQQLRALVDRIERIEAEIADMNSDKSEIYREAKSYGFDVKILREVVRLRRKDHAERVEHDTVLDLYLSALGMQ